MQKDYMRRLIELRKSGVPCGIPSFCTANPLVIEACLQHAKRFDDTVLIEATANQVNQFGGYTGMQPKDFRDFVFSLADSLGFPRDKLILGGDHLGPLVWAGESEDVAMLKAKDLVYAYVRSGFQKIHLDTSMRLGSDPVNEPLSNETIARRGAELYCVCEQAYQDSLPEFPERERPVYIIGSEVPIPGGSQEHANSLSVTEPEALEETLEAYNIAFREYGIEEGFKNIVGVVVQPGVEFGDDQVFLFDRVPAAALTAQVAKHPDIVLEGHSTDYQSPKALKEMVEAGVAILKVGPALTFALRRGLFALSMMEKELVPDTEQALFIETLEKAMLDEPGSWKKYYFGTDEQQHFKRLYSYSDRCRYYLAKPSVVVAIDKLFDNMEKVEISMGMLQQYFPTQFYQVRNGKLPLHARDLVKSVIAEVIEDYRYAVNRNYFTAGALL